jgi:ASC-1-like (ASCH) protein
MTTHHMHLNSDSYDALKRGVKNIEVRLFDEKRQKIQLGDTIEYLSLENKTLAPLRVLVIGLLRYATFADLVADFPIEKVSAKIRNKADWVQSNYTIYSREQEHRFGVLGIRIKLI